MSAVMKLVRRPHMSDTETYKRIARSVRQKYRMDMKAKLSSAVKTTAYCAFWDKFGCSIGNDICPCGDYCESGG